MRKIISFILGFITASSLFIGAIGLYIYSEYKDLPSIPDFKRCVFTNMHKLKLCPGSSDYVFINEIPQYLKDAILISEDASFYTHDGFDWTEIKESILKNIKELKFARGGSTISQQLIKNIYFNSEKSVDRKWKEAVLTYKLEQKLSKDKILELYLNIAEFGPNIYGIKRASEYYFEKETKNITITEASYLAQLLPNPNSYSEGFFDEKMPKYVKNRMNRLLTLLRKYNKIDPVEFDHSKLDLEAFPKPPNDFLDLLQEYFQDSESQE